MKDAVAYDYAVLRVVPRVHLGGAVNVGVVLHARTVDYLGLRVVTDPGWLERMVPRVDVELLSAYLSSCEAISRGDASAGPVGLVPASERFHWLTAPRSDVLHASPVHGGLTIDPEGEVDRLFQLYVAD